MNIKQVLQSIWMIYTKGDSFLGTINDWICLYDQEVKVLLLQNQFEFQFTPFFQYSVHIL